MLRRGMGKIPMYNPGPAADQQRGNTERSSAMANVVEPAANAFEPEWRYRFTAADPAGHHVVVSGNVVVAQTVNGTKDDFFEEYTVHLVVGPWWGSVSQVVPHVHFSGFENKDADDDDEQGWWISNLTWDAVSGPPGPHANEERIRLKFKIAAKGENSVPLGVSYYLIARGRELGVDGLNSPGPVHEQ
jgi:hypothetical protein